MPRTSIVLFRDDLRTLDNPALAAAMDGDDEVVALYVLDQRTAGLRAPGGAARWWLHGSLEALGDELAALGVPLVLRRGAQNTEVDRLVAETGAGRVCWNRRYEPAAVVADKALKAQLQGREVEVESFAASLLREPWTVRTADDGWFRVFTPFWRAMCAMGDPPRPLPRPGKRARKPDAPDGDRLSDWRLQPTRPDWADGLRETWQPGTAGAVRRLDGFLDDAIDRYADERNRPDLPGTSGLSPHLRFGEISPRHVWHAVRAAEAASDNGDRVRHGEAYRRELAWRDFNHNLMFNLPDIRTEPVQPAFAAFPWREDRKALEAWQRGRTGYPLVDAGMRELWHTGWMHNRVRMVVASFLVKDLLIDWRAGEEWFWDTLVDADAANNTANWQWVAGCGADAAPYFRIFNPVKQGKDFDPDGDYIRRWVPELADLPTSRLHEPWQAEADAPAGYPSPIVDHKAARQRALAALEEVKKAG